ncbi:MAG: PilZ domain-containing protein, partial [Hyphomicrobiales bacterium]
MNELAELQLENANLWILVLDFETLECEEVIASDFSREGCRVQSKKLKILDKHIGLRVAGFEKMIKGRVTQILDEEVVVSFEFNEDTTSEKRKERRRPVAISARVSSNGGSAAAIKCEIVDASLSGCRL